MKKKLIVILVGLLGFLGIGLNASAATAPNTFTSGDVIPLSEYISGISIYYKPIAGGLEVFCEDAGLKYYSGYTYKLSGQVDDGYIYILENRPNTGNTYKDYYIQSVAIWWYKDYLNGTNDNISEANKNAMLAYKDTEGTNSKLVYDLVEGAKKYKQTVGSTKFTTSSITFTEEDDYYISNKITIKSTVNAYKGFNLVDAPKGTTIVNNTVNQDGNGTFQIKVPKSSIEEGKTVTFSVKTEGSYNAKKVYDYYYASGWQKVIYGEIFTDTVNVSNTKSMSITRESINILSIIKVDTNNKALSGAELTLYKGDCTNSTCSNKYTSWTTGSSAKVLNNVPVGTYTLVETKTPSGYKTASKMLIEVKSTSGSYTYSMVDEKELKVKISKTDITGEKEVPGATLVLKDESGKEIASWVSTTKPHYETLESGNYCLTETIAPAGYILNTSSICFKLDENNNVYEKNANGEYIKVDSIKMVNEQELTVNISKTDITGEKEVPGATLVLKDESGKTIESWVSTTESHKVILKPGIYELTETIAPSGYILNKTTISFKLEADGTIYEKNSAGTWSKVNTIKMVNVSKEAIIVSKLDSETNEYVSGAKLVIKNKEGKVIATWTTAKESHYVSLEEGEYVLTEESAPAGYELNKESIYFKVDADGNLYLKDAKGEYSLANGIIMYDDAEVIEVPATGLSSTLTYIVGSLVLGFGAVILYKNEKKC